MESPWAWMDFARACAEICVNNVRIVSRSAPVRRHKWHKPGQTASLADNTDMIAIKLSDFDGFAASADSDKRKGPLTIAVNGPVEYARQDLNLQPLAPEASALSS